MIQMENNDDSKLKDLHKLLLEQVDQKKFGLRNGYIYSHVILKLLFELFVREDKIGIKSSKANLDEIEVEYLTRLIRKIDGNFEHRNYGSNKSIYSIWEIDVMKYSHKEIADILKAIDKKLF